MPIRHWYGFDRLRDKQVRRTLAAQQVREKFPALIEGSSGWHRAVANRMRRIR